MDYRTNNIIEEYLTEQLDIFTTDDFYKYLKSRGAKVSKNDASEILQVSEYVFSLVKNEFVTKAGVFTGRWFSFKPSREEVEKDSIIIGHRCIPFVNPEVPPDSICVMAEGNVVESSAKDFSMLGNSTGAKLYVFIGRNKDGTERYLRLGKQFREVPEMAADPIKHFGAKLAPIWQSGATAFTGHSIGGFEDKEISNAKGWKRVGLAAKNLGSKYVPLSVQNAYNKEVKGQGSDFTPFDLIGNTSKGMSEYKAKEQFTEAYKKGNKAEKISEIEKSMRRNGFDDKKINSIKKSTMTTYTKPFKEAYKEALSNGDVKQIDKITKDLNRKNISPIEQQKIYTKALKEFYKEMGI